MCVCVCGYFVVAFMTLMKIRNEDKMRKGERISEFSPSLSAWAGAGRGNKK